MFLASNFLLALAGIISLLLTAYTWVLIFRAVLSWVSPDPYNPIVRFLYSITEPVLFRVRRTIPAVATGIDFSPFIVLIILYFLQSFLVQSLRDLAVSLR